MLTYLIRRWLLLVPTLVLASIFIFGIIGLAPGDPVRMKIGFEATPQEVAAERERLGLDKPLPVRYAVWLSDVAQLNLGGSLVNSRPVTTLIADAFPTRCASRSRRCPVAFTGMPLAQSPSDTTPISTRSSPLQLDRPRHPCVLLGMMLILLFAVTLQWLPPSGVGNPGQPGTSACSSSSTQLPSPFRICPSSPVSSAPRLEVLDADFVRTARSKGLRERSVLNNHALRNAMLPPSRSWASSSADSWRRRDH
jgi:ABC-type dipeptide/oligopeptide/nickel transport system permease component